MVAIDIFFRPDIETGPVGIRTRVWELAYNTPRKFIPNIQFIG